MEEYNFYITSKKCKQQSKENLRYSWKIAATTTLLYYFIVAILGAIVVLPSLLFQWWMVFPMLAIALPLFCLFNYGYTAFFWHMARLEEVKSSMLFCGFSKRIFSILGTYFKKFLLLLFWLVCLIFPFFIKYLQYSMSTYILLDRKELPASNAIKESKHLMSGNVDRLSRFRFSFTLWYLLLIVTGFIAGIWVLPYIKTNEALFYEDLKTDF